MAALLRLVDIPSILGSFLSSDPRFAIASILSDQGRRQNATAIAPHSTHGPEWAHITPDVKAQWLLSVWLVLWFMTWARAWAYIVCALLSKREYVERIARKHMQDTLIKAAEWRWSIVLATDVVNRTRMPTVILSPAYFITVRNERVGMQGDLEHTATVWRWRWLKPIVPDPTAGLDTASVGSDGAMNTISILERCNNRCDDAYLHPSDEVALSARLPAEARANAERAANAMATQLRANNGDGCVFVLHGSPGSGKSTAVRALALSLKGRLLADYDPTRKGDCLPMTIAEWADADSTLVVAVEEFDVALRNIIAGVPTPDDTVLDACDKSSFNKLMDMVHRKKNVVLVMTTNLSPSDLHDICKGDKSLLRPGRVDTWFPFEAASQSVPASNTSDAASDVPWSDPAWSDRAPSSSMRHDSAASVASRRRSLSRRTSPSPKPWR